MKGKSETIESHFSPLEIDLYIDGELQPAQTSNFDQHLPKCLECRDSLRERQGLHLAIDGSLGISFFLPLEFARDTAEAASNLWSAFGRRPLPGKDIIGVWFLMATIALAINMLPVKSGEFVTRAADLPRELTAATTSVNLMLGCTETIAILILRSISQ